MSSSIALRRPALPALPWLAAVLLLILGLLCAMVLEYPRLREEVRNQTATEGPAVYFAPGGSPTAAVVAALDAAQHSVHVHAYSFTSAPIAKALVAAERRGVEVVAISIGAILPRSIRRPFPRHEGGPTFIDAKHAIAHNKIMIIDGEEVLTGSFNYTRAAEEKNAENLLVLHGAALAARYEKNWQFHRGHSEPYAGR